MLIPALLLTLIPLAAEAAPPANPVLSSLALLRKVGASVSAKSDKLGLGIANLSGAQETRLLALNHAEGRCAGFERLTPAETTGRGPARLFRELEELVERDRAWARQPRARLTLEKRAEIVTALASLKEENLRAQVEWLSSFPSRYHRQPEPNRHVGELEARLRALVAGFPGASVDTVAHNRTPQKSVRVRFPGATRPGEIVVLGGHLDSIANWGLGNSPAPGADDNASGSAALLEAMRGFVQAGKVPERTVEWFFYAGEEGGLLGSAEIAQQYKREQKDVVAVLQLDMTMFPGSGELVIGSMTDFTSPGLRAYLVAANDLYLGARIVESECGYGCSDHASWYRQGYPTLMPFESDMQHMNHNIHTERDQIDATVSFRHALVYAKIALVMAMDLGNSGLRPAQ